MSKEEIGIYRKAIAAWGPDLQLIVLMEECAELIKECSKILRARWSQLADVNYEKLIEELVDTNIMIEQMRYGWLDGLESEFKEVRKKKIDRVKNWLGIE